MKPLSTPALAAKDVVRQQVYAALLAEPGRGWTVACMAERLPDVAVNDVRTTLHLLLGDRLMDIEPVARQRSLTLRLSGDGEQMLAAILRDWQAAGLDRAACGSRGGRNAQ